MKPIYIIIIALALRIALFLYDNSKLFIKVNPEESYFEVLGNLDSLNPGKGVDIFDEDIKHRPMAYSLILRAEINRIKHTNDTNKNIIYNCGNWLLKNADLDNDGTIGYGLPDEWDAFQDGTINPINQEYTITTAMVIGSLMDWLEIEPDSQKVLTINNTIYNCLKPYLTKEAKNEKGLLSYSLNPNDKKYCVYNPTAYMAGQMQRFSTLTKNDSLSNLLKEESNTLVNVLMKNSQKDKNGNIYWNYSQESQFPNDLVHMSYIIDGLRNYKNYGGSIDMSWKKIIHHSSLFYFNYKWYEYAENDKQNAIFNSRLWGLGMLMYTLSNEQEYDVIEKTIIPQLRNYKTRQGTFRFKENNSKLMIRQDAHLLLGLSYYLFHD